MKPKIAFIVLTFNEEKNLRACLESIKPIASEIFVVDSGSTDKTVDIARSYGAEVIVHEFKNQAEQFNFALDNSDIKSDWIFRIDADEYLLPELREEILEVLPKVSEEVSGFYLRRRLYFMGRWIKHGGYYPTWILRLWRKGKGRVEERAMDEHTILLHGRAENLKNDFVDDNKNGLSSWIQKHNNYAGREAEEAVKGRYGRGRKREIYYKFPPFLRAFVYFKYRYFFQLGFLDGLAGLIYHVLHGFWYRFLVDAKIYEKHKETKRGA